eukprot:CAMPEP_0169156776 /NCGR_PEP_ID=MMETSP1015-20121227/54203_1 /TAXON_ID=342587 /ORGANISM="Karlodinium micrum, Strain CCMP2283" /LENGTH=321 /DNA_ID=CAMNT_0009227611 /DNA_START=1 /DNA_END=964 /DNA_ORIENTATION=-
MKKSAQFDVGVAATNLSKTWGHSSAGRWIASSRSSPEVDKRILMASASAPGHLHAIVNTVPPSTAGCSKNKRKPLPTQIMLFPSLLDHSEERRTPAILEAREVTQPELPRLQTPIIASTSTPADHLDTSLQTQHRTSTPVLPSLCDDATSNVMQVGQSNDEIKIDVREESQRSSTSQPVSLKLAFNPSRSLKAGEALNGATIDEWIVRRAAISGRQANASPMSAQVSLSPRPLPLPLKAGSEELEKRTEGMRQAIRLELINRIGSAHEAFRAMDLSGSGHEVSQSLLMDCGDSARRLRVDWKEITGLWKERDIFKMFDKEP